MVKIFILAILAYLIAATNAIAQPTEDAVKAMVKMDASIGAVASNGSTLPIRIYYYEVDKALAENESVLDIYLASPQANENPELTTCIKRAWSGYGLWIMSMKYDLGKTQESFESAKRHVECAKKLWAEQQAKTITKKKK